MCALTNRGLSSVTTLRSARFGWTWLWVSSLFPVRDVLELDNLDRTGEQARTRLVTRRGIRQQRKRVGWRNVGLSSSTRAVYYDSRRLPHGVLMYDEGWAPAWVLSSVGPRLVDCRQRECQGHECRCPKDEGGPDRTCGTSGSDPSRCVQAVLASCWHQRLTTCWTHAP
jgi:hypothetical protein